MKRWTPLLVLAVALLLLFLSGCGADVSKGSGDTKDSGQSDRNTHLSTETVTLNDGRVVECVVYTYDAGSIWCTP